MKKLYLCAMAVLVAATAFAQGGNTGNGGYDGDYTSLAERVFKLEKKTEGFNLFLNYGTSFQETAAGGNLSGAFRAKQLRLEIKGQFGDHLTYRLRHRLNKAQGAMSEENFAKATDIMMVGWKFNDKFAIQGGKMCQFWGGFEFDENPMYIYQYSDMVDNMDNFLAGVAFLWTPVPGQEFVVNISDSYSGKFADEYGTDARTLSDAPLEASAHPLAYIFNWNGSFFGGKFNTRWAIGSYTQAKKAGNGNYHDVMVFLGQQLKLPKFQWYVDYIRSNEELDRLRIVTGEMGLAPNTYATDVVYQTFLTKFNWQFAPKWNLMGKAMYETASATKDDTFRNYRTSLGVIGSLEYYPMADQDLRFFLAYVGRAFRYSAASAIPGSNVHRIELGLMYRIKCY